MNTSADPVPFKFEYRATPLPRRESPVRQRYEGHQPPGTYIARSGVVTDIPDYTAPPTTPGGGGTTPPSLTDDQRFAAWAAALDVHDQARHTRDWLASSSHIYTFVEYLRIVWEANGKP